MLGRKAKFLWCLLLCLPYSTWANGLPTLKITENTNSKIAELYQRLQSSKDKIKGLESERLDKLNENYQAMKEKEQSKENRTLTAASTAATGIGGMELAQGLAEQKADKSAEQDMAAHIATMHCSYGKDKQVKVGPESIELPGGNNSDLMKYRNEYFALAADLKKRKEALEMKAGIEAEEILDKAKAGLYDDENIGLDSGSYASIYRAQMLGSAADQEQIDADKKTSKNRVIGGGVAAAAGVVGGVVGDMIINKDAPKENSDKINREYDKKMKEATAEQDNITQQLNQAIAENAAAVQEYNKQVHQHKDQVALIKKSPNTCRGLFTEYISKVDEIQPIANETDNVPQNTNFPDINKQQELLKKCQECDAKGGDFDSATYACPCPNDKPVEHGGKCVKKVESVGETPISSSTLESTQPDTEIKDGNIEDSSVVIPTDENGMPADANPGEENNLNIDFDTEDWELSEEEEAEDVPIEVLQYDCENKHGGQWKGGKCVDKNGNEIKDDKAEYCPANVLLKNGKWSNGLKSINEHTKIGDECSSTNIAQGEVVWRKDKKSCTCLPYVCNKGYQATSHGSCVKEVAEQPVCPQVEYKDVPNIKTKHEALGFCAKQTAEICKAQFEKDADKKKCDNPDYEKRCKMTKAINNFGSVKGRILCNPSNEVFAEAKRRESDNKLEYLHCCETTEEFPKDTVCKCISKFADYKVTPMEAEGLMKEYAVKWHKDDIKCRDANTFHRHKNDADKALQCSSRKNSKWHYEFKFRSLDDGNKHFYDALCSIWGLNAGQHLCKDATDAQCKEISTAVNRTFFPGGSAKLTDSNVYLATKVISKSTVCNINEHSVAASGNVAVLNKTVTLDELHTIDGIDPLHFYDKTFQINATYSELYNAINNYLFVEQHLPVKQFKCGSGFVDNTNYYKGSRKQFNEMNEKQRKCIEDAQTYSGGGEYGSMGASGAVSACRSQYPVDLQTGDLLTCEYDGQKIDFFWKKLDVKWDKKSATGYQGLRCYSEGGAWTGKGCALADEKQCNDFKEKFLKDYPNYAGLKWDEDLHLCVSTDAKMVHTVQKVTETAAMVGLSLVSSVGGGPVVWALTVVEVGAIIAESVSGEKLSDWAERFVGDAARCEKNKNQSNCANAVLKNHIARIIEGTKYFDETQNKAVARQMQKLIEMFDENTMTALIDKGVNKGFITEERDPDMEKTLQAYYGTQLTTSERALIKTNKVATVLTFATLVGGGVMAGLRQAAKRGWMTISKAKQAKWVDLRILRKGDVADDVYAMTKMATNELRKLEAQIAKLEAKGSKLTQKELEELASLRKQRDALKGTMGTKTGDNVVTFDKKAIETAKSEYDEAIKRRNYVADYMSKHNGNPPKGVSKQSIKEINDNVAKAEQKLKDLGQEVTPAEPLQIGKKPTVTPAETKPVETTPTTPKPSETKPVTAPTTPKRTPAQEEAEWRALYEKYAPENQSFDEFKRIYEPNEEDLAKMSPEMRKYWESHRGSGLEAAKEVAKNWKTPKETLEAGKAADDKAGKLWAEFHKKYDVDDNNFSYATYVKLREEAVARGTYKGHPEKIPGLESWSKKQLEDANKVYEAQLEAKIAGAGNYSTVDPKISALKRELQQNNSADYNAIYKEFSEMAMNKKLTNTDIKELKAYIEGDAYDDSHVLGLLYDVNDNTVHNVTESTKTKYQEFLKAKSENVQKIDKAAGLHAGVDRTTGELIAKNEFVQNFVSKRVSMYEEIITKNPSIYNRAKRWNTLSIEEREKLCKEIFEIADNKLGVKHTDFAVRDLVKDFDEAETVSGLQLNGNVYISSRHFPNMSFRDVMDTLAHEQAHKVDKLNPNRGILGSQLEDLGRKEGYIQGYTGHAYEDYRKELTEQSSWMIGDAMKKAISKLGL